jgi:hypothetical protein
VAKRHFTDLECRETIYLTPDYVLAPIRAYFGDRIPLDPATQPTNPTRADVFCVEPPGPADLPSNGRVDGLREQWSKHDGVFVNPPYGEVMPDWCRKIYQESIFGVPIFSLLPAGPRFGTRYFQRFIFSQGLRGAFFHLGRVPFLRPDGTVAKQNPWDSAIWLYNVDLVRVAGCFDRHTKPDGRPMGKIVEMRIV